MRRFLFALSFLGFLSLALAKEVPFTQEDRDRLIWLEVKVEEGQKALQVQINGLQKQIDGLQRQVVCKFCKKVYRFSKEPLML